MESGRLRMDDDVDAVINTYLSSSEVSSSGRIAWPISTAPKGEEVIIHAIELASESGEVKTAFQIDEGFEIRINYQILEEVRNMRINLRFKTTMSETVFATYEDATIQHGFVRKPGNYLAVCKIPPNILNNMTYRIHMGFDSPRNKVLISGKEYLEVDIIDTSDGYRYAKGAFDGPIRPTVEWHVDEVD